MPRFSNRSKRNLATCHPDIQRLCNEAIKYFDFTVLEGHRGQDAQHKAFVEGRSKLDWPRGKHNSFPSKAVDLALYPVNWNDEKTWHYFIGFIIGLSRGMGLRILSGHDWDNDGDLNEHSFQDSPHFEIY